MRITIFLLPWLMSLPSCVPAATAPQPAMAPRSSQAARPEPPPAATTQTATTEIERKIDQLLAPWNSLDSPGFALSVMHKGKLILARGYGSANLEHRVAITPTTAFQIASASKQFTAFAVLLLAEEGKLSLDDDLRKHLPEVPDFGKTITLRHLIHHTSGLRDQRTLWELAGGRQADVIKQEDIMFLVRHQRELDFEPGQEMVYSNTNYILLAEVVARVSGQSFREWTTKKIFEPLGMKNTHFHDDYQEVVRNEAASYSRRGSGFEKDPFNAEIVGPSGLSTTAEDLAKWADNLDTGKVGGKNVIARMRERGKLKGGGTVDYAAGLIPGEHRGLRTVWHGGSDAGYRSAFTYYPDQRFAVIVLSNLSDLSPGEISDQIAELYLGDEMAKTKTPANKAHATAPSPARLDQYVGRFQLDTGMIVEFVREGEELVALLGKIRIPLEPDGENAFRVRGMKAGMKFERDEAGQFNRMVQHHGGDTIQGKRILSRAAPSEKELSGYLGTYYSSELDTSYDIALDKGRLVARHRSSGMIELTPLQKDEFVSDTWYFTQLRFVRGASGKVTGMRVSNARMRNLRFDRR